MTVKISELPLDSDYILDDYVPIVDSNGLITGRIKLRTLVTGSYGLSASFYSVAGALNAPAKTGAVRLEAESVGSSLAQITGRYNDTTDYPLFTFSNGASLFLGANNSGNGPYPTAHDAHVGALGDWRVVVGGALVPLKANYYYVTTTVPIIATAVTASLGVSGSLTVPISGGIFATVADAPSIPAFAYDGATTQTFGDTTGAAYNTVVNGTYVYAGNFAGGTFYLANSAAPELSGYVSSQKLYNVDTTKMNVSVPFSASLGLLVKGNSEVTLAHSGSTNNVFDAYLKVCEDRMTEVTTPGSPSKAIFTYVSGTNGKTYAVDVLVTAQSTTTTGSLYSKYSGHYFMVGGVIGVVDAPYTILESANHTYLTASLTSSAGNIIVSGTQGASAETFRWGCFVRVQEQGA